MKSPATRQVADAARLPLLITNPQWVLFAGRQFHLRREGLYRFWDFGRMHYDDAKRPPRIVSQKQRYTAIILFRRNVLTLLASLAALHVHGKEHTAWSHARQLACMKRGYLSLTCGYISRFVVALLAARGWRARTIVGLRLDQPFNLHDNGHNLVEVYSPAEGKWILADVDMHQLFVQGGRHLDAREVCALIRRGKPFQLEPLTHAGTGGFLDLSRAVRGQFCVGAAAESVFFDPVHHMEWYRHCLRHVLIEDDDKLWFFATKQLEAQRIKSYVPRAERIDESEWRRQFYGTPAD